MGIYIFNWLFLLVLVPVAFFWLRRAWRIFFKNDYAEVALKRGLPPPNAERYAPYEMLLCVFGAAVLLGVLVAVLGFQALQRDDWMAIAGITLWTKLLASFALSRHAHGIDFGRQKRQAGPEAAAAKAAKAKAKAR
jgi:hypothetical protein